MASIYSGNWTKYIFDISIHYNNGDNDLGFRVRGGADQGEFLQVGPISPFDVAYYGRTHESMWRRLFPEPSSQRNVLKQGDIILETDGWSCVGFRRREYLGLTSLRIYTSEPVIIRCVPQGCLPVSLRDFLDTDFPTGDARCDLQDAVRTNLLKTLPPVTTRAPRDGEIDKKDYCFVSFERFSEMQRNNLLLQLREYDGHYYGILKPDLNNHILTGPEIFDFRDRLLFKRNKSFMKAFGIVTNDSYMKSSEKDESSSPARNQIVHRKPVEGRSAFVL